jgi:hypothetical protein
MWMFYYWLIVFVTIHFNFTVIATEPVSISLVSLFPGDPQFCGVERSASWCPGKFGLGRQWDANGTPMGRQWDANGTPMGRQWDAKCLSFLSHTNNTFLTMRTGSLSSRRWTKKSFAIR